MPSIVEGMETLMKWQDMTFDFNDSLIEKRQEFINSLESTAHELEVLTKESTEAILVNRINDKWSIKENIGHLITVDELFYRRLDDFEAEKKELFPADMSGGGTYKANYNDQSLEAILEKLKESRSNFSRRLRAYSDEMFLRSSYHRRLDTQMRLIDMLHFMVEHDAYHTERINELLSMKEPLG